MIHTTNIDLPGVDERLEIALNELPIAIADAEISRRVHRRRRPPVKLILPLARNLR